MKPSFGFDRSKALRECTQENPVGLKEVDAHPSPEI